LLEAIEAKFAVASLAVAVELFGSTSVANVPEGLSDLPRTVASVALPPRS